MRQCFRNIAMTWQLLWFVITKKSQCDIISVRGGSLSAGSSSSGRSSSPTHRVQRGQVHKQPKNQPRKRKATGGGTSRAGTSRTAISSSRRASTSAIPAESSRSFWKDYVYSAGSSCQSPHTTWSDCSESPQRLPKGRSGILKAQNSGPTCEMPVRFQLPDSSMIVYPSKGYHTDSSHEDDDTMSFISERYAY